MYRLVPHEGAKKTNWAPEPPTGRIIAYMNEDMYRRIVAAEIKVRMHNVTVGKSPPNFTCLERITSLIG